MAKVFNVTADCKPEAHYMVDMKKRLEEIKGMVDAGKYFTINRARQYGKTTTLRALHRYLQNDYYVILMDFQTISDAKFKSENSFSATFAKLFSKGLRKNPLNSTESFGDALERMEQDARLPGFELPELFESLTEICKNADKSIVLLVDEVDSATNNQVFLDFLAQLRACYIDRDVQPCFLSVVLAGVYDIKNLRGKLRPGEEHKVNSPWNIAADFDISMSFDRDGIAGMLREYEEDFHTGMDVGAMAGLLWDYTRGYPFLVSRLCKLMDEEIGGGSESKSAAWTKEGFLEAVRMVLAEKNTLFESLIGKLSEYPELNSMLRALLFEGKSFVYNPDDSAVDMASIFGFVKNDRGSVMIANRIFEMRLYNFYLSGARMQELDIHKASLEDRSQFIADGHLDMRRILEKFVQHFHELYGDSDERFVEEEGRKFFLLYLRPIINGTGNYYIEARTRSLRRTDVIVDYRGERYVIEMKIWHGAEYNRRGEEQLLGYLEDYQLKRGYMLSFNFNQKKQIGIREVRLGDKVLIEAIV